MRTFVFLLMAVFSLNAAAQKSLLVSIHPVALLIKSAWPQLEVNALVPVNQSPHDYSLKPSDRRKLAQADFVIWLGPDFEPYLSKLMSQSAKSIRLDSLVPKEHEAENHESGHHELGHHADHKEEAHDPHLWLQPDLIPALLSHIQTQLKLDTPTDFLTAYHRQLKKAQTLLSQNKQKGFVSYHDAFHHWVKYFELNQLAVLTLNPEKPAGTRHVIEVRKILESGHAACLFIEPQFKSRLLKKLSQGLDVKQVLVDPMASDFALTDANFLGFYSNLVKQFEACLK